MRIKAEAVANLGDSSSPAAKVGVSARKPAAWHIFPAVITVAAWLVFMSAAQAAEPAAAPFVPGEKVVFSIKKFGLKVGEATLTFDNTAPVAGQPAYLIVFKAKAVNFYDEEKIFIEQKSFQPLRVERDLDIFGSKEKIVEVYDSVAGEVRIHKDAEGKVTDQVLKKSGVENIYGFIYRYRRDGKMVKGDAFAMRLPTKDLDFKITSQNRIGAGGKEYESFLMESQPKKYQLWFEAGERRIPLRIDGSMGMASTSMVMIRYEPGGAATAEK